MFYKRNKNNLAWRFAHNFVGNSNYLKLLFEMEYFVFFMYASMVAVETRSMKTTKI